MTEWKPIADAPNDGSPILIPTGEPEFPIACVIYEVEDYHGAPFGWRNSDWVRFDPEAWLSVPQI